MTVAGLHAERKENPMRYDNNRLGTRVKFEGRISEFVDGANIRFGDFLEFGECASLLPVCEQFFIIEEEQKSLYTYCNLMGKVPGHARVDSTLAASVGVRLPYADLIR